MNTTERQARLAVYGAAYDELTTALAKYPREMWQYRPSDDVWTIHEILVHITDSEASSYVRCRRFIAEPGQSLMAYDEMQWALALDYHAQSVDDAVALFRWLRQSSYRLIQTVPETAWAHTAYHPENGTMTLDDWLEVYARHVTDHATQMEAVYQAWQKSQAGS